MKETNQENHISSGLAKAAFNQLDRPRLDLLIGDIIQIRSLITGNLFSMSCVPIQKIFMYETNVVEIVDMENFAVALSFSSVFINEMSSEMVDI